MRMVHLKIALCLINPEENEADKGENIATSVVAKAWLEIKSSCGNRVWNKALQCGLLPEHLCNTVTRFDVDTTRNASFIMPFVVC
jgi:hypothetical protein